MFVFGPHLLQKAANMQKSYALKKTMPCVFFFKNTKTSCQAFLKKAQCDVFKFVTNYNLLSPLKKTQGIVFSAHYIFAYLPPTAINGDQKRTFDQIYFFAKKKLCIRKIIVYI